MIQTFTFLIIKWSHFIWLKKKNHVLDEYILTMIISYFYLERKKCNKYVVIQAADEMYLKKKDSDWNHKDNGSVPPIIP